MRTIAIINRKGGCGKTTTAVSLAAALGEAGRRTLLVDLDPQGSASSWLWTRPDRSARAVRGVPRDPAARRPGRADAGAGRRARAGSSWLVTAERSLQVDLALGAIRALERLPAEWDYVLVDCPPTLGYLASAALCGCREAVLPVHPTGSTRPASGRSSTRWAGSSGSSTRPSS